MASYAIHMYQRPGAKPAVVGGPGCGLPLRNGLHPSYSPDTPFSFYSDVYSDYGDEQCLSSFEHLADADVLDGHLPSSTDDADCARVLSIWEASWYGGSDPAIPDASYPTHAWVHASRQLSTSAPHADPAPPMPQSSQPYYPNFSPISGPLSSIDQHSSVLDPPPAAASVPVPTDVRLQPSRLSTDSAVSNSSLADTGTWKQRQFIMSIPSSDTQEEEPAPAGTLPSQIPTAREAAKAKAARTTADSEDDDDAMVAAAWRWRFTRRWKAEQARAVNPQLATSGNDYVADALLYLTAAGPANAELSRTASEVSEGALRQSIGTGGTSGLLGTDSFMHDSFSASSQPPLLAAADQQARASEQVAKFAKQAHNLLQQQRELERRVEQRAREQQVSWVGDLLGVVELDDWGKFRFVLLRVKDKQGRHKLILRGRNYAQEEVLASQCRQQVADLAAQHHLQPASVELQGSGVVEWRRDRDRHLHLCCTQVYQCAGVSMAPKDLGRMAAILVKKHLPMHYQVAADGTYVA